MAEYDRTYLRGIDQFNRGNYFESHEIRERIWLEEQGPARHFYQGLIQAAVALHHLGRGNLRGARKLLARSRASLAPYRPAYLGLDVDAFLAALAERFAPPEPRGGGPGDHPAAGPTIRLDPPAEGTQTRGP